MERNAEPSEGAGERSRSSPSLGEGFDSPQMDRNPSPPPSQDQGASEEERDAIGETVYSKHWLFGTLTRLIQTVTEQEAGDQDTEVELSEEEEAELCKIWDMAMDKDVAGFLQEFNAPHILLGAIAKSRSPRLTEICVGILGNMACFPDTCQVLSQNEDLGAVLLLLLGDADPRTLLETSRLLLTCLVQPDIAPLWLEWIRKQESVLPSLCFIMCSSTNVDLLVKVGELVDKLFDLDEELMKSWITAQLREADPESQLHIAPSLLEAAKQLRSESLEGLEVYIHVLQLLTTVDEGLQVLVEPGGAGQEVWSLLCEVVCEDMCQPDDPPIVLLEQKGLLTPAIAVLSALFTCQDQQQCQMECNLPLIGSLLRVLQYLRECQQRVRVQRAGSGDSLEEGQLQALKDTLAEFLANILTDLSKDAVSALVKGGYLTEQTCVSAAGSLLPQYLTAVRHMVVLLSEDEPKLADVLWAQFSSLKP